MRNRLLRTLTMLGMVGIGVSVTSGPSLALTPTAGTTASYLRENSLGVDLYCDLYVSNAVFCYATVYDGSEPYSYSWIGAQPSGFSPSYAIADCYPGAWTYVELLVTDSNGSTGGAWKSFQCP